MTTCKRCKITHWRSGECHALPQAVICDPPEPTVIDESDLAPGMVVVAVDDGKSDTESYGIFLCTPDARLGWCRDPLLVSATTFMSIKNAKTHSDVHYVAAKQDHS